MEAYKRLIEIIDANLIYALIPIVLTLMLVELCFRNKFETKKVLNILRWAIIAYTVFTLVFFIINLLLNPTEYGFLRRATGAYGVFFWMMSLCSIGLPFTLLHKKLASKFLYVLFVAFFMKIGVYFERYVIIVTSFHQDYLPVNGNLEIINLVLSAIGILFIQGTLIAIILLGIFELVKLKSFQK